MSYYHILKFTDLPKNFPGRLACHSENCNRSVLYLYFPFQYNQFHVCEVSTWTGTVLFSHILLQGFGIVPLAMLPMKQVLPG